MLLKSTEEVKKYLSVSMSTTFDKIKPYIESAERDYILKLLGKAQYDALLTHYNEPGTDAKLDELLGLVQSALINLAYFIGFAMISVKASDQGFQRIEGDKFKTIFKSQEDDLKETFKSDGFNGLDRVLEFLESNIEAFEKFKTSSNYTVVKASIIPNTAIFDEIYNINNSRLVFLKLRRFIKQSEDLDLLPIIGAPLYLRIKTELAKDEPNAHIVALLPVLREPLVYLSIARAIKELRVNITDNGVFFNSKETTTIDGNLKTGIPDNVALVLAEDAKRVGNEYMELVKGVLASDAEKYPEYIGYTSAVVRRNNTDKGTLWV